MRSFLKEKGRNEEMKEKRDRAGGDEKRIKVCYVHTCIRLPKRNTIIIYCKYILIKKLKQQKKVSVNKKK